MACRGRCWEYDWVVDLDVQKFCDLLRLLAAPGFENKPSRSATFHVERLRSRDWLAALRHERLRHGAGAVASEIFLGGAGQTRRCPPVGALGASR